MKISTPGDYKSELMSDPADYGPAMRKLNPRQQAFVDYVVTNGCNRGRYQEAALAAGYEDGPGIRVTAHRIVHDYKVVDAIREECDRRQNLYLPMAIKTMVTIASDPTHKDALKAATTLAAISGVSAVRKSENRNFSEITQDTVTRVREAIALLALTPEQQNRITDVNFVEIEEQDNAE